MTELLTQREVADLFRVAPRTVAMWQRKGMIKGIPTPGSSVRPRYRYRAEEIRYLLHTQVHTDNENW